jgi:tetratricopeptide (TPR) repeat protein
MSLSAVQRIASPPSHLLGRDALLRALMGRLSSESRMLIGLDPGLRCRTGVGRTAFLHELVSQVSSRFDRVFVLQGQSAASWRKSLGELAGQLDIRQREFRRSSDLISTIRGWLSLHDRWLLAVDHVNDLDDVSELLEGVGTGQLIAVVQDPSSVQTSAWSSPVPLGTLAHADAAELLRMGLGREWTSPDEQMQACEIAGLLEGNPLCAQLAGRLLQYGSLPTSQLRDMLGEQAASFPLDSVLSVSLALLEERCPGALTLLSAGVVLGPGPVPRTLLSGLADASAAPWQHLEQLGLLRPGKDGAVVFSACQELRKLLPREIQQAAISEISKSLPPRSPRFRLRELVSGTAAAGIDDLTASRVQLAQYLATQPIVDAQTADLIGSGADAALDLLLPEVAQKLWTKVLDRAVDSTQQESELLIPLVELGVAYAQGEKYQFARRRWRQAVEFCPLEHPELTELLLAIAESDVNDNRFDRAEARLNRIAEICRSQTPSDHLTLLLAQWEFLTGGVAIGLGRNAEARERFLKSVELRQSLLAADHPLLMKSRLMLARVEFLLKNLPACEQLLKAEVNIREASPRVSDTELGVALNFLGEQYYLSGRLVEAEPVYERALQVRRLTHSRGHRLIGEMANRLAVIKSTRGGYRDSDALFREALACLEETYGPEHPEVARALNDLAESLFAQNKFEPARRLLERALNIQERALRANDARLSRTRSNLAAVYVARGRYPEAVRLYEKDISLRQTKSLPDRASLATSLNNLAEALRSLGRYQDAEKRLQESLAIREQLVGPDHPQVAQILNNLGYLYLQQHRHPEAIELLRRALRIRETCLSTTHPQVATTLGTLAEVEFTAGQYTAAREHFMRAIETGSSVFGERHAQVLGLQIASARNEFRLGHYGRAELMLTRAMAIVDEVLGPDHRVSARCMLGLAELAQHEKRYDAAFPLLERSLTIMQATTSCARLELAETLRLIAENLRARNLIAEALPRVEELLDTQHAILPERHPETIPTWELLGRLRQQLKDPVGAELAYRIVLNSDRALSSDSREELQLRLVDVLIEQQKYDEARQILEALVSADADSADRTDTLPRLAQLAGVLYLQSRFEEAAIILERCVRQSEICHGPDSAETAKHLDNLAGARFLLGQFDAAEPAIQRAIRILEQEIPACPAALNKARENYSQLLRQTGRVIEADQLESQVLAAKAAVEPPTLTGSHVLDDL